jgi:tRNA A-37 threonylcarbamoyl transferase component Bud32
MSDLFGNRYHVIEKIGHGSMGQVLKCRDTWLGRNVALKVLWRHLLEHDKISTAIKPIKRFFREARELACLDHPNIVTLYDIGSENNIPYLVMPFIEGTTLDKILSYGKPAAEKALSIAIDIFDAIGYAHVMGIVHRDLKPSNIIITDSGKTMVMDFGLVRRIGSDTDLTEINSIIGTAAYISPEQAMSSRVDCRSDLYSLGIILYELFTGVKPFHGDNIFSLIIQHINVIPQPPSFHNPFINIRIERIIINLLQKKPEKRCDNAESILSELKDILSCGNEEHRERLYKERNIDFTIRLIGRDKTIYRLVCLVDMVKSGKGFLCSITGHEGTGKSRLVHEIITIASVRKVKYLKEELGEIDRFIPFYSMGKLIKELNMEKLIHDNMEITDFSSLMTDKLKDYTNLISGPLIIIFDDILHATGDTKKLLASIIKKSIFEHIPVLWVLTSHMDITDKNEPFYDSDLYNEGRLEDIKLEGLSRKEFSELTEEFLGKNRINNEAINKIHMLCKGSPLYLKEIIDYETQKKISLETDKKDIIKSRMENLKNNAFLQLLCVFHRDLNSDLAEEFLFEEFSLPDMVKYNKNNDSFSFIHPLYKNILYDNITSDIKRDLHNKIACLYEEKLKTYKKDNFFLLSVILYHFFKGDNIEKTCEYYSKVDFFASSIGAHEDLSFLCDLLKGGRH